MKPLLLVLSACLCSCVVADGTSIKALGGKGAYESNDQGGFTLVWNAEKSFYHGTVLAGVLGTAGASAYSESLKAGVDKAAISSSTAKHAASEQTVRQVSDNAVKVGTTSIGSNAALEIGSDPVGVMNAVKP